MAVGGFGGWGVALPPVTRRERSAGGACGGAACGVACGARLRRRRKLGHRRQGRRRGLMLGQEERNMGNGVARTCGCRRATQLWTDTALGRDRAQQPRPRLKAAQGSPSLRQSGSVRTNRDLSVDFCPCFCIVILPLFAHSELEADAARLALGPTPSSCGGCVPGARTLPAVGSGR